MTGPFRAAALAATISLAALAACSPKTTPDPVATPTAAGTPPGSSLDAKTTSYIADAGQGMMFEIEAATLAVERSKVPEVKAFAQTILDYHKTGLEQLKPLAEAAAVTLPTELNGKYADRIKDLRDASEADFDDKYIDIEQASLSEAADTHKDYANDGSSANLKELAGTVFPNAEMYLGQVKALDKSPADDKTKPG